jgi:hypothetical protein
MRIWDGCGSRFFVGGWVGKIGMMGGGDPGIGRIGRYRKCWCHRIHRLKLLVVCGPWVERLCDDRKEYITVPRVNESCKHARTDRRKCAPRNSWFVPHPTHSPKSMLMAHLIL